ncbi:methyltransferase domain-containing protein [Alphaproteobacteria bacterium GH1-50]|uniref:Methyltransferase domain-containing protein n=1 Tax=Kangsaoukella pontilimi TaxID=2691042 RepID=A0A7C9MZ44_9RHOB|nr:methyltransferase domain-containing protein [Kangsaoukella pontilimi]MXQ07198.1 methyltransferase domain-containing protein [Kangsaoukella pontilimi]
MSETPKDDLWSRLTPEESQRLYAGWAESYDADVASWGYATPARLALALRQSGANVEKPVLDVGCGTGLCGMALRAVGFDVIDGTDISPEMLARAEARGVYRQVWKGEPGTLGHIKPADYPILSACGVVGHGAAPPEMLDLLIAALGAGGLLAFSFNDATLADRAYTDRLDIACLAPDIELVFEQHGPHLPAKGMMSTVYVLKRT